jgi:hypothetical protein
LDWTTPTEGNAVELNKNKLGEEVYLFDNNKEFNPGLKIVIGKQSTINNAQFASGYNNGV